MREDSVAITARGVCFGYGPQDVVHEVTLDLARGQVTVIAGPNGSGKSTLVELLAGVLRPRRGSITREGDLALVVQRPDAPATLPVTARDVVTMGTWKAGGRSAARQRRDTVEHALDRVGMTPHAHRPLTDLSGGQRQRVFLAQGIVRSPDVLLLDEPAAGLDHDSVARAQQILAEEAARGVAVICVSHDREAVATADRVIRLEAGRVS